MMTNEGIGWKKIRRMRSELFGGECPLSCEPCETFDCEQCELPERDQEQSEEVRHG